MPKRFLILLLFFTIFLFLSANNATAKMYKWVDEKGVTHFSDTPPETDQELETIRTPNYPPAKKRESENQNPASKRPPNARKQDQQPEKRSDKVEIFMTSWCPYCKKAIAFFKSNGIPFKEYDIEKDPRAKKRMEALGGKKSGVPFIVINGQIIRGYSPYHFKQALGL